MTQSVNSGYAKAFQIVAATEGNFDKVRNELLAVSELFNTNTELRSSISDKLVPAATRFQIISEALGGKVSETTQSLVSMVAATGRGSSLPDIVAEFVSGDNKGTQLATVTSAVALSESQKQRLAQNLQNSLGGIVEIQNVVDPNVVGGVVTTIGDRVIDGTIRNSLEQMKDSI